MKATVEYHFEWCDHEKKFHEDVKYTKMLSDYPLDSQNNLVNLQVS